MEDVVPLGFRFGAVSAGLKASGKPDLACAVSDGPAAAAAMFTSNRVVAAPLMIGKRHLRESGGRIRAVVVNSGNANCATGEEGLRGAEAVCANAAGIFGCPANAIFPSSTGIIGVPFPTGKLISALPALQAALGRSPGHLEQMARAIMTTDTVPKAASARIEAGPGARVTGIAKGAGMIHPRMIPAAPHATMLAYLFTDAAIEPELASQVLQAAVEKSFHRISVDGDTSTNDTVLLLAGGAAGITIEERDRAGLRAFQNAVDEVCLSLAKQIVLDGEGAQHLVELIVTGAASDAEAVVVARSIAHSPLVKTAWAGCDPNWGRILAAAGYAGVPLNPNRISISVGPSELCRNGAVSPAFNEAEAAEYLRQREITVAIALGSGTGSCRFWTTDLTVEYVHINADYST